MEKGRIYLPLREVASPLVGELAAAILRGRLGARGIVRR